MLHPETQRQDIADQHELIAHLQEIIATPLVPPSVRGWAAQSLEIARRQLRRQLADRLALVTALASCSHTRPQERPRTHRHIEAPELWR